MNDDTAISMQHIDVLFGPLSQQQQALQLLDEGQSRDDILSSTGIVLGVSDACLDISLGSISVLMGLSGSGKSSLLRCINGLNAITRGELHVKTTAGMIDVASCKGRSLRDLRRHHLAMVFQQFALLPWATVRENIGFGLSIRGEAQSVIDQQVDRQLELVGLEAWADKAIHTLSGGMQQRVGLARAFATDAEILLMDEPFSALDPLIREHLQDELIELQNRLKKTIVFVSHDLDEALKLGNQISIMEGGNIVQTGTAKDIVFSPATDYVSRFVANINPLSVLTAETMMGIPEVDDGIVHHVKSGLQLVLQGGSPLSASLRNQEKALLFNQEGEQLFADLSAARRVNTVLCIRGDTPIKMILKLMQHTALPIVVLTDSGQFAGILDAFDVIAALSQDAAVASL